ncbi:hypothetical protein GBP98_06225 [Mycobacterium avium subsp. hominissuis]|uniref:hypothetical protein n=1 Tax=Mycobacterium avium TaxID=1764 RepID=UPI0007A0619D|nr:hypothetical protein [Mycobacterium avium]MBZ4504964.1 hypothetical protein [Mycobacterium avium subsp. hominissuis]
MQNPFLGEGKAEITRRLPDDVSSDTVDDYIEDVWARALSIVPVIADDTWPPKPEKAAQIKAILRAIILRWHEAQSGAATGRSNTAGPYSQALQLDARPKRGYTLMPSEVTDLQRVCMTKGRPFTVSTIAETVGPPQHFGNGPHAHTSAIPDRPITFDNPDMEVHLNAWTTR